MTTFNLQLKGDEEHISVLQLTDLHLFAEEAGTLLGVRTADSFKAVLEAVVNQSLHFDIVVVTGDISQDYSVSSYQRFAHAIAMLQKPVFFVPGNHDDGPLMYRILHNFGVHTERSLICNNWQFVFLNSEVYSVPHGWVERDQLNYLKACCDNHPELNTAVLVHHLPRLVRSNWLDTQTMHNQDEFNNFIAGFPNIKLVLSGHVHQEYDQVHDGIRYIATPSTSIQFEPLSHDFALDMQGPGWRYLRFDRNGGIDTQVFRLPSGRFIPDTGVGGY
ncbi:3',5'-cyclic-AMP phosphodiesterase [Anaerobiospirillum sp. NML120449]|uniref:3',5'-cyclic-AMP phosphodiesterase n=1 Tax=Anaerobiospirillum sp. NML120449 TaxID=2932817 RepID=UPI001FF64977|nr:3',5'-cyclic-AMP phosphodiesterase [Anaerobiospirillum sp. NML120449]MCK0526874.1 3',5'-cyclic-AMP phosphodiesterase [Anaerobiospirillum sp. NML120449]